MPTKYEEKIAKKILRQLRLRGTPVKFQYYDKNSRREITFEWDGAGLDSKGTLTLVEVEAGSIDRWHIETHITRLAVMIDRGEKISKLAWVSNPGCYQELKDIVDSWKAFLEPLLKFKLPDFEYYSPDGSLLP